MCGIAGLLAGPTAAAEADLLGIARRMEASLAHRGPDDAGVWVDASAGVALAHRRLSILDLSPLGHQPMDSPCGRYVITYNGEMYNFRDLRAELSSAGTAFRSQSDTEVLLAAVSRWGVRGALDRVNGMFAFALWDRRDRRLYLARDRMGEKPLYYGWAGTTCLFASELKALRAHPAFAPRIDRGAVASYLRFGCVPAPGCIYEGVFKLPPGHLLALDGDRPQARPAPVAYWSLREAAEAGQARAAWPSPAAALARLEELLRDAVRLRMEADVPLGAFLSGGTDSTAVVALMQAQSGRAVRTFTIGFEEADYDEAGDARAVARHLGTAHTELYVTPGEARGVIPRLPRMYDEPFADSSQIPTFLVSELARRDVTVSLSGDGGDELFGGYERYVVGPAIWKAVGRVPRWLGAAAGRALAAATAWPPVQPTQRLRTLGEMLAVEGPAGVYLRTRSHWTEPARLLREAREEPSPLSEEVLAADLPDLASWMMYADAAGYLPDDILVKLDRASMAVSLEARVPLLDHRVVEFAWTLPLELKVREGERKWLLRELVRRHVPPALVDRPKQGFCVPIGAWLRGPLRGWAEALLDEDRIRREGLLEPAPIRQKWEEHRSGRRSWEHHLWDVLMLQAWLEEWT